MALTYTPISSNILSTSAASITFSSIPSTYTDLIIKASARSTTASVWANITTTINGNGTSATYTFTYMNGQQNTFTTSGRGNQTVNDTLSGNSTTANTFSSIEYYIPSYTVSQSKAFQVIGNINNNDGTNYAQNSSAYLYSNSTAISSITLAATGSFAAGSSFYLYGIKNS